MSRLAYILVVSVLYLGSGVLCAVPFSVADPAKAAAPAKPPAVLQVSMSGKDIRVGASSESSPVAHRVTISRGARGWAVRDDAGPKPVGRAPCVAVSDAPAVSCPSLATRALVSLEGTEEGGIKVVARDLAGLAVSMFVLGGADVDVRGGESDEVACEWGDDVVWADANDRVYGACETLNGRRWQDDTTLTADAVEYDSLDDMLAWTDARGALFTSTQGASPRRFALSGNRKIERLNLGREGGRPVAAFRARRSGSAGTWYVLDLVSTRLRRLPATVPAGCRSDSLAVWDRTVTIGATCGDVGVVLQRTGSRTRRVLRRSIADTYFGGAYGNRGVWVDGRESNVAIKIRGDIWLAQTGAKPCARQLDSGQYEGSANWVLAPARLAKDRILWPGYDASEFFSDFAWIEVDDIRAACKITRHVAIIPERALAAATDDASLTRLVARRVLTRPLDLTPWPIVPRPFWGEH